MHRHLLIKRCYFKNVPLSIFKGSELKSRDTKIDYKYFKDLQNALHPEIETAVPLIKQSVKPSSTQVVENTLKKLQDEETRCDAQKQHETPAPIHQISLAFKEEKIVSILNDEHVTLHRTKKSILNANIQPEKLKEMTVENKPIDDVTTPIQNVSLLTTTDQPFKKRHELESQEERSKKPVLNKDIQQKKKLTQEKECMPKIQLENHMKFSEVLQEFEKLGVDLKKWETLSSVPEMIISKNFNRDVKPYIDFLVDNGLPVNQLGYYFTKNPYILLFSIDNLRRRINYYKLKNFSPEAIAFMISKAIFLLNAKTSVVEKRFKYFQDEIKLTEDEIRIVCSQQPKLITFDYKKIKIIHETLVRELQISPMEIKILFMNKPKLWLTDKDSIRDRFNYVHKVMGISGADIARCPELLLRRKFIIKQRHLFLVSINRADYEWPKENGFSLKDFIWCNDKEFCNIVAKTSTKKFKEFIKTL